MEHRKHQVASNDTNTRRGVASIVLLAVVWILASGCATDNTQTLRVDPADSAGASEQAQTAAVEPLTDDTEDVFDEYGFDPFEEPDSEKIEEYDPWEPMNALFFEFNYQFDKYILKPIAQGYDFVVPKAVQRSIFNFFQNLRSAPRFFNNVFQAKFQGAGIELSRFLINSTLGIGGLFDPASQMFDLSTPLEDTGQTLGVYGVPPGPYLVLPFLGSYTVRDTVGYMGDLALDPFNWLVLPIIEIADAPRLFEHDDTIQIAQSAITVENIVNLRALNLEKFQGVEEGTLDLYSAVRNAYLQQRLNAIRK